MLDHPRRDLVTVAMIALALVRRGCAVNIIPLYQQGCDVPLLALDAIVTTFARPASRQLVERYRAQGIDVYVLDTEGGVLANEGPNAPDTLAATLRDEGWGELLAGYFCWGPVLRDALLGAGTFPAGRLHLTGCPRYDPVALPWRGMLDYCRHGYILVNTAFPAVNSCFTSDGEDRAAMLNSGWDPAYVDRLIKDNRAAMQGMLELVGRLAARFPDRVFLLRPHPFENQATYERALAGQPNVVISGAGSVLNVIANALCVVQLNCSTAIESVMLDKLPFSPDFLSTPFLREHSPLPNELSYSIDTEDRLIACLSDVSATAASFDFAGIYARLAQPYFFLRDGAAADRIAEILARPSTRPATVSVMESLRACQSRPRLTQRLQGLLVNVLGSRFISRLRDRLAPRRKNKHLQISALIDVLTAAVRCSGEAMPAVDHHRHPVTGARLASFDVRSKEKA